MRSKIKRIPLGLLTAAVLSVLSGCGPVGVAETPAQPSRPLDTPAVSTPEPEPTPTEQIPEVVLPVTVSSPEDIQAELLGSIQGIRQPVPMEVSGLEWQYTPDIDVKNLYYGILSQNPELGYAYDVSASLDDDLLTCQVSYMPYKTGEYPEGRKYCPVSTFEELISVAEESLGGEPMPVRFTDSSWIPEQINHALAQVGGAYVLCSLNRDGTEIVYSPAMGMEMEECLDALEEVGVLAETIYSQVVTDKMTEKEKAFALYSYLTSHVQYDQRYYTDLDHMPYQSRTALGALRDNMAICGGLSNAVKILFEKAGIPCYNVSGTCMQENHMWNIAYLDGAWRWFDATTDRGNTGEYGFLRFAVEELDPLKYQWDEKSIHMLLN